MEQNKKIGYKDIFKQKEYMKMMVAALINRFGDSIDAIASTWIVYELTGSAVWSAVIFGVNKVPSVFVTPLAGAWVEGRNKNCLLYTSTERCTSGFYQSRTPNRSSSNHNQRCMWFWFEMCQ